MLDTCPTKMTIRENQKVGWEVCTRSGLIQIQGWTHSSGCCSVCAFVCSLFFLLCFVSLELINTDPDMNDQNLPKFQDMTLAF